MRIFFPFFFLTIELHRHHVPFKCQKFSAGQVENKTDPPPHLPPPLPVPVAKRQTLCHEVACDRLGTNDGS